jgi:hypothetical protein
MPRTAITTRPAAGVDLRVGQGRRQAGEIGDILLLERIGTQRGDHHRRFLDIFRAALRRDDDVLDAGAGGLLCIAADLRLILRLRESRSRHQKDRRVAPEDNRDVFTHPSPDPSCGFLILIVMKTDVFMPLLANS